MPRIPKISILEQKARLAQAYNRLMNNPSRYPWGAANRKSDLDMLYRNDFFVEGFEPSPYRSELRRSDSFNDDRYQYMPFKDYIDMFGGHNYAANYLPEEIDDVVSIGRRLPRREVEAMNDRIEEWLMMNRRKR